MKRLNHNIVRKAIVFISIAAALALTSSNSHALLPPHQINASQAPATVAFILHPSYSKCTAVKVAPRVFLTAAHCFNLYKPGYDIELEQNSKNKQTAQVRTQIETLEVHPMFANPSAAKMAFERAIGSLPDLALFKTKLDINIPFADINFNRVEVGQKILMGGFGEQGKGICHAILHACSLNMAVQTISKVYHDSFATEPSRNNPFYLTPGDSGGPAYVRNSKTQQLEVVGINSMMWPFSISQAINILASNTPPESASLYTRISEYEAWYVNIFRELTRDPHEFDEIQPPNPADFKFLENAPGVHDPKVFGNN